MSTPRIAVTSEADRHVVYIEEGHRIIALAHGEGDLGQVLRHAAMLERSRGR